MNSFVRHGTVLAGLLAPYIAHAATLHVGPGQAYATPCQAVAAASNGDTILIDAAGKSAQGKAIWIIGGDHTTVDNIEFSSYRVPDENGASIRQQGTHLTMRHSYFHDNEMGILTSADADSTLTIEYSEFTDNGFELH